MGHRVYGAVKTKRRIRRTKRRSIPDDGGGEQISLVGERRDRRLAEYNVDQYDAGKTHEHCREPAGKRVLA